MAEKMVEKPLITAELEAALIQKLTKAGYTPEQVKTIMQVTKSKDLNMQYGGGIDMNDVNTIWETRHSGKPVTKGDLVMTMLKGPKLASPEVAEISTKKTSPQVRGHAYDVQADRKNFVVFCEKPISGTDTERRRILLNEADNKVLGVQIRDAIGELKDSTVDELKKALLKDGRASILRSVTQ